MEPAPRGHLVCQAPGAVLKPMLSDEGWAPGMLFHKAPHLQPQRCDSCSVIPQARHCTALGLPCGKGLVNLSLLTPSPGLAVAPLAGWGLLRTPRHRSLRAPASSALHSGPKSTAHPSSAAASQASPLPSRGACRDALRAGGPQLCC